MHVNRDEKDQISSIDDLIRDSQRGLGRELVVTDDCSIGILFNDSINQNWEAVFIANEERKVEDITQQVRAGREIIIDVPGIYYLRAINEQGKLIDCYDWFCFTYHYDTQQRFFSYL